MYRLTAASRDIPLGTMIRVTRLDNNRAVSVKVNDRGPFVEGRILDLSYEAARRLDMLEVGLAKVRIETLAAGTGEVGAVAAAVPEPAAPPPPTVYWVSLGGFSSKANAVWMRDNLVGAFPDAAILILQENDYELRLVTLGPYKAIDEANVAVAGSSGWPSGDGPRGRRPLADLSHLSHGGNGLGPGAFTPTKCSRTECALRGGPPRRHPAHSQPDRGGKTGGERGTVLRTLLE